MEQRKIGFDYRVTLDDMEYAAFQDPHQSKQELIRLFYEHIARENQRRKKR